MTIRAVTVYTNGPACQACNLTKRHLTKRGIDFDEVAINSDNIDAITFLGFSTAPIVCVATTEGEQSWDGFRPDRINALVRAA